MNRKLVHTLFLTVLMAGLMLSASAARADLLINFTPSTVSGSPGQTIEFWATFTATSNVSLDSESIVLADPGAPGASWFSINDFWTTNAAIPFTMSASDAPINLHLFDVTITNNAVPYANFLGTYQIVDFNRPGGNPYVGNFEVNVVPEPASMLLLGSGLTGLVGVVRRKRQK